MKKLCLIMLGLLVLSNTASAGVKSSEPLDKIVAIVNDDVITQSSLREQIDLIKKQLAEQGTQIPSEQELQKQVMAHLIDASLQLQLAQTNGIEINDQQLDQAINNVASQNNLTIAQLKQKLQQQGVSYPSYRENVKKDMTISQLQRQIVASKVNITPEEINDFLLAHKNDKKQQSQYHVKDILIATSEEPTPEEVAGAKRRAYDIVKQLKQGRNFSTAAVAESNNTQALRGGDLGWRKLVEYPTVFAQRLADMKIGDISPPIRTGNGYHIIKLVATRGDQTQKHLMAETHVRHILIKKDALTTDHEIKVKLQKLRKRIVKGEKFAALAKEYSQDAGSAVKGGDIGWIRPGKVVPQFERAMNKLKRRQISQPVQSAFGWHIIQVLGRKKVDATKMVASEKAREILFQRKFQAQLQNWLQTIRAQGYVRVMANA